jgi:phage terminase large subunit-like protein
VGRRRKQKARDGDDRREWITRVCRELIPGYDPWRDAGDCGFDPDRALIAVDFFPASLRHCKGALAGTPFRLADWQAAAIGNLFGWYRPDGSRRYRYVLIYVPRKNGKTALAAGVILYVLFVDGEPGAEIYGAASEYGQACMVFDQAMGMVRQNPVMAADCKMYLGQSKAIVSRDDPLTVYRVIAYSPKSLHGGNTHVAVVDELHCLPNRELVDVLNTSKGSRLQPIQIYLTTADYERPGSVCNEIHDKAKAVRDGSWDDPTFLPIIYEAAKDDDWTDPAIWAKANPNLGISFPQTYLEEQVHEAKRAPGFENSVKRLHLNIRTEQADKWISLAEWDRAKPFTFDPDELLGKECQAGFDLGYVSDLTVLCLLFPWGDDAYRALWWFWTPRERALEDARKRNVPYLAWDQAGLINLTSGAETDYNMVRREVIAILKRYAVVDFAMDRTFQGHQLSHDLAADGVNVVAFGQGYISMCAPTKDLGVLIRRGKLHHNNNPVARWMIDGMCIAHDAAGNIKPDKRASTVKIDAIVTAIMALGRAMDRPRPKRSPYEDRGPVILDA